MSPDSSTTEAQNEPTQQPQPEQSEGGEKSSVGGNELADAIARQKAEGKDIMGRPKQPDAEKPKRERKPAQKQPAKTNGKADADAAKTAKRELTELSKKVKSKGHTAADIRKAKQLAETAGASVPSWVPKEQAQRAQPRADDPDLQLAHKATALATGGSVTKDGHLEPGPVKFGANVSAVQIKAVREQVKGKDILKMLGGVSEAALARYAKGEIKSGELPEKAKAALSALNKEFPPKMKMWARKDAAILVILHRERKHRSSAKAKQQAAAAA